MAKGTLVSGIFFGPPGTSKTDLAKHISNYLGWPLHTVDPAYFMRDGLDKIQIQADRLFEMLNEAERVVVLLDEFDEMVRDRTNSSEVLSRFLTTAMLPKLARIKKSNRIVFLVVTNHIDEFDLAVRRPGRFDMILQIMPPTTTAKLAKWFRVAVALDRWNLANDQSVLEKLERLTFNEFEAAAPTLANASSAADLKLKLDEAYRNCTLSDEVETGVDWYEVCRRQRRRIRPPGLNDGWLEPAVSAATEGEIG